MTKRIAVFASGNGSNFQVIAEQFPVEFVFSDHRDAYVLERAENLGVLSYAFELKEFENKADYEGAIVELLDEHQIDLVCLAGYMKIVGPTLLAAYEGRIINIHPAYLPEFPGAHGIEDAWNAGVAESGVILGREEHAANRLTHNNNMPLRVRHSCTSKLFFKVTAAAMQHCA